jgi:hypothetical protein
MRNTLEDYEFNNAIKEVETLLKNIYCLEDNKHDVDMPIAKEFVFAVLESIGINY